MFERFKLHIYFCRCCQDLTTNEIEEKVCKYIPNILDWIKKHCKFKYQNTFADISITKVEDIEENVWCPKYGLKGKIDMTVTAFCRNQAAPKVVEVIFFYYSSPKTHSLIIFIS